MIAEWINLFAQVIMAIAASLSAAAAVYATYLLWKQQRASRGKTLSDEQYEKRGHIAAKSIEPIATLNAPNDLLNELIEVVQQKDEARSQNYREMWKAGTRPPIRMLIAVIVASTVSVSMAAIFSALFASEVLRGILMTLAGISILAFFIIGVRLHNTANDKAWHQALKRVHEVEDGLEDLLVAKAKDERFTPEMALTLHDNILKSKPRVLPAMILMVDRVLIAELVGRLRKTSL